MPDPISLSDPTSKTFEDVWNSIEDKTPSSELPEVLAEEAKTSYGDINVRPFFAKLGIDLEAARDNKAGMKLNEVRELRNKLGTITTFLDKANYALKNTTSNDIQLTEHADLLFEVKKMLPEHASKLIGDRSTFKRHEVEWLCQMFTRKIDTEISPQIDELKDEVFDIMQMFDKILPILKDLLKKYDDHIAYIIRQAR